MMLSADSVSCNNLPGTAAGSGEVFQMRINTEYGVVDHSVSSTQPSTGTTNNLSNGN